MLRVARSDPQRVVEDLVTNVRRSNDPADADDLVGIEDALEIVDRVRLSSWARDDLALGRLARVAEVHRDRETIELSLRQRVGAVMLERVLGCDDEQRIGQRMADAVDGDRVLVHRLQAEPIGCGASSG